MELEKQVCNLELAKRLKELGVEQESYFWWNSAECYQGEQEPAIEWFVSATTPTDAIREYAAFTVAELGEMLPATLGEGTQQRHIFFGKSGARQMVWLGINSLDIRDHNSFVEGTEAHARAAMLIYLIENKLIQP